MRFRERHAKRRSPNPDLTPLIDVVFQLLLFFMLSSTFVVQTSIQIEMPQAEGATRLETKDVSVTLAYGTDGPDGKGKIFVNNDEIPSIEDLSRRLSQEAQRQPDLQLLVRTDSRTDTGRLIEVLGIAGSVGIEKYQLLAAPPDEG
jgi:biopolymer transport protein ExbD